MISPTYGEVTKERMFEIITNYVTKNKDSRYEITVGADSQSFKRRTKYVLVVAVREVGHGGIFFYETKWFDNPKSLQIKIHGEVQMSLEMAVDVNDYVMGLNKDNVVFAHIDIDIGTNGETKQFVREVRGWIEAMGHVPVLIKGQKVNQVASCIADKLSK